MQKTSDILWQDAQHQVLFEILDRIREPDADIDIIARLKDYTENHFILEERYMEVLEYPERVEHTAAHNRFRQEIDNLVESKESPDEVFREIIATYLTEWLKRHVFGIDKRLEDFIARSAIK